MNIQLLNKELIKKMKKIILNYYKVQLTPLLTVILMTINISLKLIRPHHMRSKIQLTILMRHNKNQMLMHQTIIINSSIKIASNIMHKINISLRRNILLTSPNNKPKVKITTTTLNQLNLINIRKNNTKLKDINNNNNSINNSSSNITYLNRLVIRHQINNTNLTRNSRIVLLLQQLLLNSILLNNNSKINKVLPQISLVSNNTSKNHNNNSKDSITH